MTEEENLFDDVEDEAVEAAPPPDDATLAKIRDLAEKLVYARDLIARISEKLAKAQLYQKGIEENLLPAAMIEAGMLEFKLVGGGKIELITEHYAGISEANATAAFAALEDEGHGGIIKRNVSIAFAKGENEAAESFIKLIEASFPERAFNDKKSVHAATLGAFVREQIKKGTLIEGSKLWNLLGVYTRRYAEVKLPGEEKKRKGKK